MMKLMKITTMFIGLIAILAFSISGLAADVNGKWAAQAQGADITLTLKVEGTALTGTLNNSQAGEVEIRDGKLNGDEISFYVVRNINDTEMKISWKGKMAGDEIKFTREVIGGQGGPGAAAAEIIAKRVK
jgi:hypothetical protein